MAKTYLDIINTKLLAAQYREQRKDLLNFLPFTLTLNNNIFKRQYIEQEVFLQLDLSKKKEKAKKDKGKKKKGKEKKKVKKKVKKGGRRKKGRKKRII